MTAAPPYQKHKNKRLAENSVRINILF